MRAPLHPSQRSRTIVALASVLALAFLAGACSRELPLPPKAAVATSHAGRLSAIGIHPESVDGEVVVTIAPGTDLNRLAADYDATLVEGEAYSTAVIAPPAGVSADSLALRLTRDPRVLTSETNVLFQSAEAQQEAFGFDDGYGSPQAALGQPAFNALGIPVAQRTSTGSGVTVAILDTGIDPTHPLFQGRLVPGHDFVDNDEDPTDVGDGIDNDQDGFIDEAYGHGTHVAGIVAMTAPGARLMIVRVLDAEGYGDMRNVAAGVRWAVAHGARIINLSLGSLERSAAVSQALDDAREAGVLVVAAAGNRGTDVPAEFPARDEDVMAIAAEDLEGQATLFTSYGWFVAMAAPGVEVRSAYPGNRWYLWSGTSMSAPFVSGTAALLLSKHPEWGAYQLIQRMRQTAGAVRPATAAMIGKLGAGSLDVAGALAPDAAPGGITSTDDPTLGDSMR